MNVIAKEFLIQHRVRLFVILFVSIFYVFYTLNNASLPEIYSFANQVELGTLNALINSPVHLSDDVMISLRSGNFIRISGIPAFNRIDLAQPSTGWAAPFVYWAITAIAPQNLGVLLFAALGFLFALLTLIIILVFTKDLLFSSCVLGLLTITTTNSLYSLNGWDHVYQSFFFVLGLCLTLRVKIEPKTILPISLILTFGTFCRLDGLPIAFAILLIALFRSQKKVHAIFFGFFPFVASILGALFAANFSFGNFLPTTARLKLGASPSIEYAFWYFFKSSIFSFTILVLFLILFMWGIAYRTNLPRLEFYVIFSASLITAFIAFLNSDYFQGGRMYWLATLMLITFLSCCKKSSFLDSELRKFLYRLKDKTQSSFNSHTDVKFLTYMLITILLLVSFFPDPKVLTNRMKIDTHEEISASQTAKFYVATDWINTNLNPKDGSIGLFYAGMAFHLMEFETADFLGKADELIARSDRKWGPPGHNKWDIGATLKKWHPQAIIPSGSLDDPTTNVALKNALHEIEYKSDFGFAPTLIVNRDIRVNYNWCKVTVSYKDFDVTEGLFIRKDISQALLRNSNCTAFPKS